jgi:hypothetical protein
MNSTITYEQTAFRRPAEINPNNARPRAFGQGVLDWLGRVAERSGNARRAETFARLNALSDAELAAMGLDRHELLLRCFGGRVLL